MFLRRYRRRRLRAREFPPEWLPFLERNFLHYRLLPEPDLRELLGHVQVFLAEKRFFGGGGFEVTDEMRVTVAAYACLLLLRRTTDYFPRMRTVVLYPAEYLAPYRERDPSGVVVEGYQVRSGEAWQRGPVVLSWEAVLRDSRRGRGCRHVVIHEFAHQLDYESGYAEGTPAIAGRVPQEEWTRVMSAEYRRLRRMALLGRPTLLDRYGTEFPTEFFAVAVEAFFMCPWELHRRHPDLYRALRAFFRQDPARDWPPPPGADGRAT
ncbi:MAG: zinc-dependent peptidase [Caldiserica bacterium]|nr:zinc-dependent peptidase [Caldisericota bacterium]